MAADFSIGRLAKATGCTVQTIRFYEQIGLLRQPERNQGNQRRYTLADERRLAFIRHCRDLGFTLEAAGELLRLADDPAQPCDNIDRIAQEHLRTIERRIDQLQELRAALQHIVTECRGGSIAECQIVRALEDDRHCFNNDHPCAQNQSS